VNAIVSSFVSLKPGAGNARLERNRPVQLLISAAHQFLRLILGMATLQDVRAFVKRQGDLSLEELERKVAAEFKMSRDEAAQMMRGLQTEDPSLEPAQPTLLQASVVAGGLAGTTAMGNSENAPGVAALMVNEGDVVKDVTLEEDKNRKEGRDD
jgi:hypothetical protein